MSIKEHCVDIGNKLCRLSLDELIKICNNKVDEIKAYNPTTALIIFVYNTEYKHNIFQLCVYKDSNKHRLIWRPFINNALGQVLVREEDLRDFLGSYLVIEIANMNLQDELKQLVAEQKLTEDELKKINNGGKDIKEDNKALQEYTKEAVSKDSSLTGLPTVMNGLGMPKSNPFLNQYNEDILKGKDAPAILSNNQMIDRLNSGTVKQTKSGIYLIQN